MTSRRLHKNKGNFKMLKIRLKRLGAKKNPTYRIIVINSTTKREGRPVQELGHYNPKTKVMKLDKVSALEWVKKGAQPTETVAYLIKNCNDDGTLNYVKKETVKLWDQAFNHESSWWNAMMSLERDMDANTYLDRLEHSRKQQERRRQYERDRSEIQRHR